MKIIGLTGQTGSGKGVVGKILTEKGAVVIDADLVAHEIILKGKPAYKELVECFGEEILDEAGEIIRRRLGEMVFSQGKKAVKVLNECTHKYIHMELEDRIRKFEKIGEKVVVIDAPLLLEGNFKDLCQEVWVVYAEDELRLQRIMKRDDISKAHAENRMASQKEWSEYKKHADVIICNNKDINYVVEQVEKYYNL